MKNNIFWLFFGIVSFILTIYFIIVKTNYIGGDIIEYYGNSESFLNHGGFNLTKDDKANLVARLGSGYFDNPEYYIEGLDGQRYSVHFPLYSLFNVPGRLILRALGADEYRTFALTNMIVLTLASWYIMRKFLTTFGRRFAYLVFVYFSPIIWHVIWPGPEVFNFSLMLLSLFLFFGAGEKGKLAAIVLGGIASYQSQPLLFIPLGFLILYYIGKIRGFKEGQIQFRPRDLLILIGLLVVIFLPNIYYQAVFGVLSAWFKLTDVGFENSSSKKFVELFFDPNIGIFFFAPMLVLEGIFAFAIAMRKELSAKVLFLALALVTAFYLINTNWNNGTAGYGPTRYALHLLPVFVYFIVRRIEANARLIGVLVFTVITQLAVMSFNGYLTPVFANTVKHTPLARLVLERWPKLYNPTPEVFVERTTEKEGGYWDSTVFRVEGKCRKAYVLIIDIPQAEEECGPIPQEYRKKLDNPYLRIANYDRSLVTTEATFYPAESACAWDAKEQENPYTCMRTLEEVMEYTGIRDEGRWEKVDNKVGYWHLLWGRPARIKLPRGYVIDHYTFRGAYVNY